MSKYPCFLYFLCLQFIHCKNIETKEAEKNQPLFNLLDSSRTGINFQNAVVETPEFNVITYRNFYNGGGVAIGDINNDGLADIFFTSNQNKNKLYLNKGGLSFEDITTKAGVGGTRAWSTGVTMADVNGDGWLDIYVCNSGDLAGQNKENELFINNQHLGFDEQAKAYGLNNEGFSTHAAFFDYDRDGDLDCYILNNSFKNPDKIELYAEMRKIPDALGGDKLMRNDGQKFTDVTSQAGIYSSVIGFGLGVATGDVNQDGWPDLYISNDFFEKDYLYINNTQGGFTEELNSRMDYCSTSSMGSDMADINGDGYPEIFSTDMLPADNDRIKRMVAFEPYHLEDYRYRANYYYQFTQNCLHLNDGKGYFQEISQLAGVAATDWSWGAILFDFQNDGLQDIFVANGIYKDIMDGDFREFIYDDKNRQEGMGSKNLGLSNQLSSTALRNYAFVQEGPYKFKDKAETLGLQHKTYSNGSAYGDLDNDGDLDLILNNVNQPGMVYENTASQSANTYLRIKLKGSESNTFGIGAKVILKSADRMWVKENFTNRGFQSSIEPYLLFGLGAVHSIDELTVIWPDGKFERLKNQAVNQTLVLDQKNAVTVYKNTSDNTKPLFLEEKINEILPGAVHHENIYNDFNQEPLLLSMLSTQGPRLIQADVDHNNTLDILLLGARGDADKLFIQQTDGTFNQTNQATFEKDKNFESTCAAFIDYDVDGDQDLLIGAGGNEPSNDKLAFIIRMYKNDGKGQFVAAPDLIPPVIGNFSTIQVSDMDEDGYPDVFIGGRTVPGNYGLIPSSYVLKNNQGGWKDVSPIELNNIGMVTDAAWSDLNKDGWSDLVVVGEWMPVTIFYNTKGSLNRATAIKNTQGWWQRIKTDDLDQDGDVDLVLGNWGLNSKFQPTDQNPMIMQVGDFDENGKSEFIINWAAPLDNSLYPFCTKQELTAQVPSLRKISLQYKDFASMTIQELFPTLSKEKVSELRVVQLQSGIAWNQQDSFVFNALPVETQIAPVMAIIIQDFDRDKIKDIVIGGNFFGLKPQMGRQSAGRGLFLKGSGSRTFNAVIHSGLNLKNQVRDIIVNNDLMIVGNNNASCQVYKIK